jgi:hypothetical protein
VKCAFNVTVHETCYKSANYSTVLFIGAGAIQSGGARAPPFLEVGGKTGTDGALHPGTVLSGYDYQISALCNIFTSMKNPIRYNVSPSFKFT